MNRELSPPPVPFPYENATAAAVSPDTDPGRQVVAGTGEQWSAADRLDFPESSGAYPPRLGTVSEHRGPASGPDGALAKETIVADLQSYADFGAHPDWVAEGPRKAANAPVFESQEGLSALSDGMTAKIKALGSSAVTFLRGGK